MIETLSALNDYYDLLTIEPGETWLTIKITGIKDDTFISVTTTKLEDALQQLLISTVRAKI